MTDNYFKAGSYHEWGINVFPFDSTSPTSTRAAYDAATAERLEPVALFAPVALPGPWAKCPIVGVSR